MAKAVAPKKAPSPIEVFPEIEQGSPEWFELRLGIPTASNFALVTRDSEAKTRREYMHKLAGEILTGRPAEGKIMTAAMQRGHDMEPEARDHYAKKNIVKIDQVGFIRRLLPSGRYVGTSPDGLMEARKGANWRKALEIKTMAPHLMIGLLERGAALPPEHRWQVYGTMWVADIEEVDLMLYYRGMPVAPKFTVVRNDAAIKEVSDAVEVFDHELNNLVKKIRAMGGER